MEIGNDPAKGRTWFWAKEAAAYIGVHPETLKIYTRLRGRSRPPFFKLGTDHRYRFPKKEFIEWAKGSSK